MMTLVTGGCKCGKSHYAEKLLENFAGKKYYIATMEPYGEEAMTAIARHRKLRAGKGFETIERYTDIEGLVMPEGAGEGTAESDCGCTSADCEHEEKRAPELSSVCAPAEFRLPRGCGILLECTANLCANEMFKDGRVCDPTEKVLRGFRRLRDISAELVIVTNEVGCDGISYEEGTAEYIRVLETVNRLTAQMADRVVECVYGIPVVLK